MTLTETMTMVIKSKMVCTCSWHRLHLADPLIEFSAEDKSAFLLRLLGPRNQRALTERSEQLREGSAKVRATLGAGVPVTDREIDESLWHYYYDVEKTVNYLLSIAILSVQALNSYLCDQDQQAKATAKITNKQTEAPNPKFANGRSDFFSHARTLYPKFSSHKEDYRVFLGGMSQPSTPL